MSNENYIIQTGITVDNKKVVSGIWKTFETHGIPLDIIFTICMRKESVPDWIALYHDMKLSGMKHARILSKLEEAVADSFGKHWSDIVISRLDNKFKDNK